MKDPGLEAFVTALESHLRGRRGVDHALSPREFVLARSWHVAGVPLSVVLVGIDRALEKAPHATSLTFCRPFVEAVAGTLARPGKAASHAETNPANDPPATLPAVEPRLEQLLAALETRAAPAGGFAAAACRIRELLALLAGPERPARDRVQQALRAIEADVAEAAIHALTPAESAADEAEAVRVVQRMRGRVAASALDEAKQRYLAERARLRLGLPRVDPL